MSHWLTVRDFQPPLEGGCLSAPYHTAFNRTAAFSRNDQRIELKNQSRYQLWPQGAIL